MLKKAFSWADEQVNAVEFLGTSWYPMECRKKSGM